MAHPGYQVPTTPEEKRAASIRIRKRRAQVAALVLQRVPLRDIAERLECSVQTVRKDQQKMLEAWSREAGTRIDLMVGRELAALDQDELALRLAMREDKDPRERLKYFDRIAEVGRERRKLLGLDKATQIGIRFEGSLTATTEVRSAEWYQAMLADPEARKAIIDRWCTATGLPPGPPAAPAATTPPSLPGHAGNGKAG